MNDAIEAMTTSLQQQFAFRSNRPEKPEEFSATSTPDDGSTPPTPKSPQLPCMIYIFRYTICTL